MALDQAWKSADRECNYVSSPIVTLSHGGEVLELGKSESNVEWHCPTSLAIGGNAYLIIGVSGITNSINGKNKIIAKGGSTLTKENYKVMSDLNRGIMKFEGADTPKVVVTSTVLILGSIAALIFGRFQPRS